MFYHEYIGVLVLSTISIASEIGAVIDVVPLYGMIVVLGSIVSIWSRPATDLDQPETSAVWQELLELQQAALRIDARDALAAYLDKISALLGVVSGADAVWIDNFTEQPDTSDQISHYSNGTVPQPILVSDYDISPPPTLNVSNELQYIMPLPLETPRGKHGTVVIGFANPLPTVNAEAWILCQQLVQAASSATHQALEKVQYSVNQNVLLAEEAFHTVFNEALDAMLIINGDGNILHANLATRRILGYLISDIVGRHFSFFLPDLSAIDEFTYLDRVSIYDAVLEGHELLCADGSLCPVDVTVSIIMWRGQPSVLLTLRDITERKQAESEINRRNRELFTLEYTSATITASPDLNFLLETIAQELATLLEAEACTVLRIDEVNYRIEPLAHTRTTASVEGTSEALPWMLSKSADSLLPIVDREIKVIQADDPALRPIEKLYFANNKIEQIIMLPMEFQDQVVGIVHITFVHPQQFDDHVFRLAQLIANQAASVIQCHGLRREAQRTTDQLLTLRNLERSVARSLNMAAVYEALSEFAPELLHYDRLAIALRDEDGYRIVYEQPTGQSSLIGLVLTTAQHMSDVSDPEPEIVPNLHDVGDWPGVEHLLAEGLQSVMVLPLVGKGKVLGSWILGAKQLNAFHSHDIALGQSIATYGRAGQRSPERAPGSGGRYAAQGDWDADQRLRCHQGVEDQYRAAAVHVAHAHLRRCRRECAGHDP